MAFGSDLLRTLYVPWRVGTGLYQARSKRWICLIRPVPPAMSPALFTPQPCSYLSPIHTLTMITPKTFKHQTDETTIAMITQDG